MKTNTFYTYILTNKGHTVLYIGFTNDLKRRLNQHIYSSSKGFARKYNATKLIWFETTQYVNNAIKRETN